MLAIKYLSWLALLAVVSTGNNLANADSAGLTVTNVRILGGSVFMAKIYLAGGKLEPTPYTSRRLPQVCIEYPRLLTNAS